MTDARRPLRIAYVVGEFPSVSETFVLNQITGLMERGHHVDVWADRPGTIDRRNRGSGIATCYAVGAWPRLLVGILLRPRRLLKLALAARYGRPGLMALRYATAEKRHYDVIHAHFGTNGLKAAALRDIGVLSGPLVTTFHAVDLTRFVRRFGRDMYRALFRGGALFLPIGEYARKKLEALGCPKERVVVHRMGVDTCEFAPAAERRSADEGLNILTVGRLVEKKGVSYGIRAVAEVARRGRKVNYNIVGDGPLRAELQELADAN